MSAWINEIEQITEGKTTFIITSDHRENLGYESDKYNFNYLTSLTEAILHVPLILINPPSDYPETIEKIASHLDLKKLV